MMIILFRPFDLGKWFLIGFSAFLAGLIGGGNGVNSSYQGNNFPSKSHRGFAGTLTPQEQWHQVQGQISHFFSGYTGGVLAVFFVVVFLCVIALMLVFFWLGARGQFMFLDNVVRNRGAIAAPWNYYARQANSFFLFYLLCTAVSFLLLLPVIAAAIVLAWPLMQQSRWPAGGEIIEFLVLGLVYFAIALVVSVALFVIREFAVPIMFRQGTLARSAFFESVKLIQKFPGSVTVFVLLRIAIFIAVAIISVVVCCATCCIGLLPYIGTVALLPALVFVRCFTLDCLAQFGPEYDAFTVDATPLVPGSGPSFTPPPPLG